MSALRVLADRTVRMPGAPAGGCALAFGYSGYVGAGRLGAALVRERERALREQMALRILAEAEDADDAAAINLYGAPACRQERLDETLGVRWRIPPVTPPSSRRWRTCRRTVWTVNPSTVSSTVAAVLPPAALERLRAFAEQMRVLCRLSEDLGTLLYD